MIDIYAAAGESRRHRGEHEGAHRHAAEADHHHPLCAEPVHGSNGRDASQRRHQRADPCCAFSGSPSLFRCSGSPFGSVLWFGLLVRSLGSPLGCA
jgi:hypothetical protein